MADKKMKITSEGIFHSGKKGVNWQKNIDTWRASISAFGKTYTLGFNPNMYELFAIVDKAYAAREQGEEAFLKFYEEEVGRGRRVVTPCIYQSDVVGVSFNTKTNKWLSAISIENRKYILGAFDLQEDAESLRKEADVIKDTCEHTETESGIIDYTPLFEFLEKLRIERQQSRLDARIGKGHGKRAWKALKKEQSKLDEMELKSLKGELRKELKEFKKKDKEVPVKSISEYPTIKYALGAYYVFIVGLDGKEIYIGKTRNILQAVLLFEMGSSKVKTDAWWDFYQVDINMGLKLPTMDELLAYFDLSSERYDRMSKVSGTFGYGANPFVKESFDNVTVCYRDYRSKCGEVIDKDRLVFEGASYVVIDNTKAPLRGFSFMMKKGEVVSLSDGVIDTLYDVDEANAHVSEGNFWNWYIFESGIFENMESSEESEDAA